MPASARTKPVSPPARERVVKAARRLMEQGGSADFSMRALSEMAGVSSATPYNLFGSKGAIISAVVDEDLARLQKALMHIEAGPIEAFFRLNDVVAEIFAEAPALYKAGARVVAAPSGPADNAEERLRFHAPRFLVLRNLVADAVQAGAISHKINPDTFALHVGQQLLSWILMWGMGQLSLDEMRLRTAYALALTLSAIAAEGERPALEARLLETQEALRAFDRKRFAIAL